MSTTAIQPTAPARPVLSAEQRVRAAHAWYCDLLGISYDVRWVEREWFVALDAFDARDIARAARYVKQKIVRDGWDRNAALPRNFLQPDKLAEYVAISSPREKRATGEDAELVKTFAELIGEAVRDLTTPPPPEGWREWLLERYPNATITTWEALPKDVQREVREGANTQGE